MIYDNMISADFCEEMNKWAVYSGAEHAEPSIDSTEESFALSNHIHRE